MSTSTLPPARTLDANRYCETFAVFVGRSHEYPAMLDRLVETASTCPEDFSCLDVGAGTGMVIRDWLAREGRRPGRYMAIEPNASHAASLRKTLAELDIDWELREERFDPSYAIPRRYDLVLFSHSLYWMPNAIDCVVHAHESLNAGGSVVAFLQSPLGIHPLFRLFDPLFHRDGPSGPDHGFSSHELVRGLRAANLAPSVAYDPSPIDLTGLFDEGSERDRDEFLSFCLQIEFAELAEPLKSDVIDYLRTACVEQGGRLNWYEPTATVRVRASEPT